MKRWLGFTLVAPLAVMIGAALPASAQPFPARDFEGWLCVIDLDNPAFGNVGNADPSQSTFDSRKLCTGGPRPNVMIECRMQIEGWPARNLNARNAAVPCLINVTPCDIPGENGTPLVTATSSMLTINRNGSARLQCNYRR